MLNSELLQRLDLGRPPSLQGSLREAALAIIARQSLESGLVVARERPNLDGLPDFLASLDWSRDARRPMLPWRSATSVATKGGALGLDAALVQQMMKHGVGRPSTWPSHAARFAERGFVDDAYQLTTKGLRVLEAAPQGFEMFSVRSGSRTCCRSVAAKFHTWSTMPCRLPWRAMPSWLLI